MHIKLSNVFDDVIKQLPRTACKFIKQTSKHELNIMKVRHYRRHWFTILGISLS